MATDLHLPHSEYLYLSDVCTVGAKLVQAHDRLTAGEAAAFEKAELGWAEVLADQQVGSRIEAIAPGFCSAFGTTAAAAHRRMSNNFERLTEAEIDALSVLREGVRRLIEHLSRARSKAAINGKLMQPSALDWHAGPAREDESRMRAIRWSEKHKDS